MGKVLDEPQAGFDRQRHETDIAICYKISPALLAISAIVSNTSMIS